MSWGDTEASNVAPICTVAEMTELQPSLEAVALVPKSLAFASRLVPLRLDGRKLVCAGTLPFEWGQLRSFEGRVCREVEIVGASAEAIEVGLRQIYGESHFDEADALAEAVSAKPKRTPKTVDLAHAKRLTTGPMKVYAVTSGKGGVGKSSTTANLAIALAKQSYRVGVIDCDFGLSNLHVTLGARPEWNLSDVMSKRVPMVEAFELVQGGIYLLAGPTGAAEFADLNYTSLQNAGAGLSELESQFDFLFLDTAAGIHDGVMSLLMAADEVVLVLTPDPASILDAYVTARALFERRPSAVVKCIVNQAANDSEAKLIFAKFMTFIGLNTNGRASFLGKVQFDKSVVQASRTKTPVTIGYPKTVASRDFDSVASKLAGTPVYADATDNLLSRFFSGLKAA